jgi:DNA-binding transcriptional MerR regulator
MSQADKSALYQALKAAGYPFSKHYREYSVADLQAILSQARAEGRPVPEIRERVQQPSMQEQLERPRSTPPVRAKDPNELAGARLNSKSADEPIRTDEQGRVWFQEEVLKPAYPKPRGRRVLKYMNPGVVTKTVQNGDYVETFEVSGDPMNAQQAEVKITLPSYQVGVYKDPRFPFKVVCYNGNEGFDLEEVQAFYGGAELVPAEVKRKYVENVLCYDIRSTVRAIQEEYRQHQLSGKIR